MQRFLRAHDYLEKLILGNLSVQRPNAAFDLDMMLRQISGSYSSCDYEKAIAGFGFLDDGRFHVTLDKELICHNAACNAWAQRLSNQFLIAESSIAVSTASRPSISLRPLAVGHENLAIRNGYGTMAGFIGPRWVNDPYRIFSNNHVLSAGGALGDRVYSMEDGTTQIGSLENALPIYSDAINYLDLAVAVLNGYEPSGRPNTVGYRLPQKYETVKKTGARTDTTFGQVVSTQYNVPIDFNGTSAYFKDQLMIVSTIKGGKFSDKGDSGSMVKTIDGSFAGLLFADNDWQTFANKSTRVMQQLNQWGYV